MTKTDKLPFLKMVSKYKKNFLPIWCLPFLGLLLIILGATKPILAIILLPYAIWAFSKLDHLGNKPEISQFQVRLVSVVIPFFVMFLFTHLILKFDLSVF